MLKFDEPYRPSFIELAKLVLTSTENTIESPKGVGGGIKHNKVGGSAHGKNVESKKVNKTFSSQNFKENININALGNINNDSNTASN